jgi:hypothetical protein
MGIKTTRIEVKVAFKKDILAFKPEDSMKKAEFMISEKAKDLEGDLLGEVEGAISRLEAIQSIRPNLLLNYEFFITFFTSIMVKIPESA